MIVTTVARNELKEVHITLLPSAGETLQSMVARLAASLENQKAEIVKFDVFGPVDQFGEFMAHLENTYGKPDIPITWIEGKPCSDTAIAGVQVRALSGVPVETLFLDSKPVARIYEDDLARHLFLADLLPDDISATNAEQTLSVLENLEKALSVAGMHMSNLVRTWFYNDRILDWYGDFNTVRSRFYDERGVFDSLLPASTGIGGGNPAGAALVVGARALQAKEKRITVKELASPIQCPAPRYGSSFSRAVEIATPGCRAVTVSGTASIAEDGETIYMDDVDAQIRFTMEVVEAIFKSCGMGFPDVVRAVAYFKNAKDVQAFERYLKSNDIPALPVVSAQDDICRDDLLFEIEADALKRR